MTVRADSVRNREALISAAELVFAEQGARVPLQQIAERAQVGRGTLYRHFPNRAALVFAVFEARMLNFEAFSADRLEDPRLAETILIEMLDTQSRTPGLVTTILASGRYSERLEELTERTLAYLAPAVTLAQKSGRLVPDSSPRDFLLAWSMFDAVSSTPEHSDRAAQITRSRALLLRSLLTPKAIADL